MAIQSNVFYFLSLGFNYLWDASKFVNRMGTGKLNFRRRRKCLSKKDCSLYKLNVEFKCQYLMKHCYLLWKSTIILGGPFGHLIMKVLGWPRGFIIFLPKRYFLHSSFGLVPATLDSSTSVAVQNESWIFTPVCRRLGKNIKQRLR